MGKGLHHSHRGDANGRLPGRLDRRSFLFQSCGRERLDPLRRTKPESRHRPKCDSTGRRRHRLYLRHGPVKGRTTNPRPLSRALSKACSLGRDDCNSRNQNTKSGKEAHSDGLASAHIDRTSGSFELLDTECHNTPPSKGEIRELSIGRVNNNP